MQNPWIPDLPDLDAIRAELARLGLAAPAGVPSPEAPPPAPPPPAPAPAEAGLMPAGYDLAKWANPAHQTPKYAIGRILSKYPPTPDGLRQAQAELEASGLATVVGKDRIQLLPGAGEFAGQIVDVGQGFSGGAGNWYWGGDPASGGGAGTGSQGDVTGAVAPWATQAAITPTDALAPWTIPFSGAPFVSPSSSAGTSLSTYLSGMPASEFVPPPAFVPPSAEAIFEDPGVQARLSEGQKALERASGARLHTGATLKALQRYNQDLASQEYANVYGRRLGENELAYTRALGENQLAYGRGWSEDERTYGRALNENQLAYGRGWNEFNRAYDVFAANQDRPFNKLFAITNLGAQSAAGLGGLGAQYAGLGNQTAGWGASGAADYWTQAANATAAGQVAGSNAWNPVFGAIQQSAVPILDWWQSRQPAATSSNWPAEWG